MTIDPKTTALVLIEYQNDFGPEGGALHGAVEEVMDIVDGQCFVKGSWGAAIIDELAPLQGDIVIEGKRGLDTFASTNLDFILRSKGINTIVLGGFLTNCCVESTMRTGYEHGYQVVTLTNCMAATSIEQHDNAITYDFFDVFSTDDVG
jgi:nicotinamidase-related amidase